MKRFLMMAMMAVCAVTAAFADDDEFKVVEGSFVDVVRQRGKTATVEFDYLDATIADRENSGRTLKQWLQDEDGNPDYRIFVKATKFSTGNSGAAYWSFSKRDGGIIISGDLRIVETSTGNTVCKINLIDYRGASSRNLDFKFPNFNRRMQMFHKSFAKDLLQDIQK